MEGLLGNITSDSWIFLWMLIFHTDFKCHFWDANNLLKFFSSIFFCSFSSDTFRCGVYHWLIFFKNCASSEDYAIFVWLPSSSSFPLASSVNYHLHVSSPPFPQVHSWKEAVSFFSQSTLFVSPWFHSSMFSSIPTFVKLHSFLFLFLHDILSVYLHENSLKVLIFILTLFIIDHVYTPYNSEE